jgi:hypothetical protein
MVVAFSVVLFACGDEDDDFSKKNPEDGGGRPRGSSTGGKPGTTPDGSGEEDAGEELEPDDLDGGESVELDGSSGDRDSGAPAGDAGGPGDGGRDARADAQSVGSDGGGGACASPAEACETVDCCAGATCIIEPESGDPICAAECSAPSECNSGCCVSVRDSDLGACVPASYCEAPPVPMGSDCGALVLIAEDGTFLGNAISSPVASNGVCNAVSPHGSSVGAHSIFNAVGLYGSAVSSQSAYSSLTRTPPALMCEESREIVAFVTKNQLVSGAPLVDPDALCVVLANSGL